MTTDKIRRAPLFLLLVHAIIVQVISYAMRPAISYGFLDIGDGGVWIGVATAAFALPPLLLAVPAGRLTDISGERTSLLIGAGGFVIASSLALLFGHSIAGLITATVFLGIGVLFSVVGEQTWVMRCASRGKIDNLFGLYTFATSCGQMLGPFLLMQPSVGETPRLGTIAVACMAISTFCLLLSAFVRSTGRSHFKRAANANMFPDAWLLVRKRGVTQALIASSLVLTSLDLLLAYLPMLAQQRGFSSTALATILVARGLATMSSRLALGRLTSRFGRRRVLVISSCWAAFALLILGIPTPLWVLIIACAIYGFAAGAVQPLTMSWITLLTPLDQRGIGASLRLMGNRTGQTLLPLAAAGLSAISGPAAIFVATGTSLFVAGWLAKSTPNGDGILDD